MAKEPEKIGSRDELETRLSEILTRGTLYRPFIYTGEGLDFDTHGEHGEAHRFGILPSQIRMFCENDRCQAEEWWQTADQHGHIFFESEMPLHVRYYCKNCGQLTTHYWIEWTKSNGIATFIKVGQWPALTIEPPVILAKALGKEDTRLYKKALINASISHGIAALAYFRRVIENKVNLLLDLVEQAAKAAQVHPDELKEIEEVKAGKHVDVKIEFAAKILPVHLRPGGQNPFERLYGIASAGLHGESDDECVSRFQEYRTAFEYLFQNLTEQNEHAQEYIKQMAKPIHPKGK
jgi:hypothetical protein